MRAPAFMFTLHVTRNAFAGVTGSGGPSYGSDETLKAYIEPVNTRLRTREGSEAQVAARLYLRHDATIGIGDKITHNGQHYRVLEAAPLYNDVGQIHHWECELGRP